MKHFLVTRFNLRHPEWKSLKNGEEVLTKNWLEHRFKLFENYCLPSVINQENKNFIWCIFFDKETPLEFKNKIDSLTKNYPNFKIIYIDGFPELKSSLKELIKLNISSDDKYIITTRLDNDDIIHQDFISKIKTLYKERDNTIIDLTRGYQICFKEKATIIRNYKSCYNPFISLIEKVTNFDTIISKGHNEWNKTKSVIKYETSNLWIQLIHDKNFSNTSLSSNKLISKINLKEYGLDTEIKPINKFKVELINLINLPIKIMFWIKSFF